MKNKIIYFVMLIIMTEYVQSLEGFGNCDFGRYSFGSCIIAPISTSESTGIGGGSISIPQDFIDKIAEQQKQYFINSSCSITVKPEMINLDNYNNNRIVEIRYLNPYILNFSSSLIAASDLPSAIDYIEKSQSSEILYEKLNITIKMKEGISSEKLRFATLLLDFGMCGKHGVPITIQPRFLIGDKLTIENIYLSIREFLMMIMEFLKNIIK